MLTFNTLNIGVNVKSKLFFHVIYRTLIHQH